MSRQETTTEQITSSRGARLAVHHFGGDGPTLMVNHATGFHAHCYAPMMSVLTESFTVHAVDFAGHGGSEAPPNDDFAWTHFAQDLLDAIDHIGATSVAAFGHSMGGAATLLAEKARPGVISAAWLFEPIIFPPEIMPRNSMMAEAAKQRRRTFPSRAEALARYASRPPLGTLRADALANYVQHGFVETGENDGSVTLACAPEHEAATFNHAGTSVNDIRGLEPRTTIAFGQTFSEPNPAQFAAPTAEALANAVLTPYAGLSHFGPMQDPDRISRDAVDFLQSS
jgi:pimeloyl-ACP methyl ester carboxylesterase